MKGIQPDIYSCLGHLIGGQQSDIHSLVDHPFRGQQSDIDSQSGHPTRSQQPGNHSKRDILLEDYSLISYPNGDISFRANSLISISIWIVASENSLVAIPNRLKYATKYHLVRYTREHRSKFGVHSNHSHSNSVQSILLFSVCNFCVGDILCLHLCHFPLAGTIFIYRLKIKIR